MPQFTYKALDSAGAKTTGTLSAISEAAALDALTARDVFVTRIAEAKNGAKKDAERLAVSPRTRVGANEIVLMVRRLATLVNSDIPLSEGLHALSRQAESAAFRGVLAQVTEDVRHGQSLSHSLAKFPRAFPPLMVSMVRVGETGGILGNVLEQLADFVERDREVRGEVKAALAYPALVMILAVAVVTFLMTSIVPKLMDMFSGMGGALPLPTLMLLGISNGFTRYGLFVLVAIVGVVAAGFWWSRTPQGSLFLENLRLRLPLFGTLMRKTAIARFARTLGALVRGGVPLMEALDVVREVLDSEVMGQSVDRMKERVRKGDPMAKGLGTEDLFPEMVAYMISAGEDSGTLDEMLFKVADIYEMETRNATKVLLSILAPMLLLCVACIVGFIAMAMLLPIFQINQMVG